MRIDLTDIAFRYKPVVRLHPSDSVVVALRDIEAGELLDAAELPGLWRGRVCAAAVGSNAVGLAASAFDAVSRPSGDSLAVWIA